MVYSHSQILKFSLTTLAIAMTLCVGRFGVQATSGNTQSISQASLRESFGDGNFVRFRRGAIDTDARPDLDTSGRDGLAIESSVTTSGLATGKQTRVIQFKGAIKKEWIERIKTTGAKIIGYVPDNAYLIRGDAQTLARVAALDAGSQADQARPIRWMSDIQAIQKIAPELDRYLSGDAGATVAVEIELLDCEETTAAIEYIKYVSEKANQTADKRSPVHQPDLDRSQRRFLNYIVVSAEMPVTELENTAALSEVLFISPSRSMKLHDERSLQIIAGNLNADKTQPSGAGYLNWLAAKGLDYAPDFIVDFADSGIDRGSTLDSLAHPDFLDPLQHSRIMYSQNYAVGFDDKRGHGTLVASVAAGSGATNRADSAGYLYGLGVDPKLKVGASRIFSDTGAQPFGLSYTAVVSNAYAAGARISNNSWGDGSNAYDAAAQEYDALTRDAQPSVSGNQEMVFIFSAGNSGAGGRISSPGTAKNLITVAASENYRPEGRDDCNLDGQGGIGPEGADNALDILRYSSGGPTLDGRAKPDLTAPGTHIHGAASQSPGFFGVGICPGIPIFQPPNQQLYTWSSGTSLAAPHVTGAAALLRKFFTQRSLLGGAAPSPAMTKAFLITSALYMTGESAGGNLPQERQGWGLVNLSEAFAHTNRRLLDQSQLFTGSGQVYEMRGALADRSQPLRVTLAWTDAPGSLIGPALVNNLDVEIKIGDAVIYRGNNFAGQFSMADGQADHLNNVESIVIRPELIPTGHEGNFTITVRAANIAGDGVPGNASELDQDFALVITNITDPVDVPPPPPVKKPAITSITYAKKILTITGRDFTAAARVEINGQVIDMPFTFNAAANSLSIKLKAKKLKLISDTNNQIVLIEGNERSQPFIIRV
jgi:subtilisin family serine protease